MYALFVCVLASLCLTYSLRSAEQSAQSWKSLEKAFGKRDIKILDSYGYPAHTHILNNWSLHHARPTIKMRLYVFQ